MPAQPGGANAGIMACWPVQRKLSQARGSEVLVTSSVELTVSLSALLRVVAILYFCFFVNREVTII